jgi:long-chain acyl-CoA synthetase
MSKVGCTDYQVKSELGEFNTLPKLLMQHYLEHPERIAMRLKDYGIWNSYTYEDYYLHVKYFALGLVASIGFRRGDKLAIIGENQPQWYWGELAAQSIGGVITGVFTDCIPSEVKHIVMNSDSKIVIAHDQEQVDKILEIKDELPFLEKVIYWDPKGLWFYDEPFLMSWDDVEKLGREFDQENTNYFESELAQGQAEDISVLIYTSGTTGLPKGAMFTHKAMIAAMQSVFQRDPWPQTVSYLSYAPLAWADQFFGVTAGMIRGFRIDLPEHPETVKENIREAGPAVIFYGARLWENISASVQARIAESGWLNRFMYKLCLSVGYKVVDMKFKKEKPNLLWLFLGIMANIILFRPLRDKLGLLYIRYAYSGGAALGPETIRFFHTIGVNLKQIYGLVETGSMNTMHQDGNIVPESSGLPLSGNEIKISPEGEVLIRTRGLFSGYYKNPESFREKVDNDGWFHSGDFGYINEGGQLIVIDRMSDMRVLSNGHKFSPQYTEVRLRFSPYIKDVLIVGKPDKDYIIAIVNIDFDNVGKWAESHHMAYTTFTDLSQKDPVAEIIDKEVKRVNHGLPEEARIRKFVLLNKEFDADEEELTRTRKLRREFVENKYNYLIKEMYSDKQNIVTEAAITYKDGRKGLIKTDIKIRMVEGE